MKNEIKEASIKAFEELDSCVKETRATHKAVITEYENALAEWNRTPKNILLGDYSGTAKKAMAEARWMEAKNSLQGKVEGIWRDFDGKRQKIRQRLVNTIAEAETLSAGDIDPAAVALLNSGTMTARDFERMAKDYAENATVLALLRRGAGEYADRFLENNLDDAAAAKERLEVIRIIEGAKTGGEKAIDAFDAWSSAVNTLAGRDKSGNFYSRDRMLSPSLDGWEEVCNSVNVDS